MPIARVCDPGLFNEHFHGARGAHPARPHSIAEITNETHVGVALNLLLVFRRPVRWKCPKGPCRACSAWRSIAKSIETTGNGDAVAVRIVASHSRTLTYPVQGWILEPGKGLGKRGLGQLLASVCVPNRVLFMPAPTACRGHVRGGSRMRGHQQDLLPGWRKHRNW
eukprot:COSAG05_NODE_2577_length_2878_cov_215.916877_3_plen_166_part_00